MPIEAKLGDVVSTKVDVLILKYAEGFRGADLAVACKLGIQSTKLPAGSYQFFTAAGKIAPHEVLLFSVGPLRDFDYSQINKFAETTIDIVSRERPNAMRIGITVHGPNYGLDELASIASLVDGIRRSTPINSGETNIIVDIIEFDTKRYGKLEGFLSEGAVDKSQSLNSLFSPGAARAISSGGTYERRIFAAMPFKEQFLDHW